MSYSYIKQQNEIISKCWDSICELHSLSTGRKTKQLKQIRKDFIGNCTVVVEDLVSVANAAECAGQDSEGSSSTKKKGKKQEVPKDVPAPKRSSTTKRVSASVECGEPKSKRVVTIEPKAKKSTKKAEIQSPLPTKKKKSSTKN